VTTIAPSRPPEGYVHGLDGPCVVVPARVAALLVTRAGLAGFHARHRGLDAEVDACIVALKVAAAAWRARHVGSDRGTDPAGAGGRPSPSWLTSRAAGARLGITPRAVVKAIGAGRLPAQWACGCWWIDPADVEHYRTQRDTP
jgi:hypothetical protein